MRFPPPPCSRPVILIRGNGHRPDKSHFLGPPKFPPPPKKIAGYLFPPPFAISQWLMYANSSQAVKPKWLQHVKCCTLFLCRIPDKAMAATEHFRSIVLCVRLVQACPGALKSWYRSKAPVRGVSHKSENSSKISFNMDLCSA